MTNVVMFGAPGRPNPERFKEARRAKGLSQTELAETLGLTRQAVSAYELGERQPEPMIFVRMAQVLSQPISYFTSDRPETAGPIGPAFYRSRKSTSKALNDRCEVWRQWFAQSAHLFSQYVKFPDVVLPRFSPKSGKFYTIEEIEAAAVHCRRVWEIGDGPIANLVQLAESKGVITARAAFASDQVDAFSFWAGTNPMVVLSSDKNACARSRFDLAHEIGHLVLHAGIGEEELEDKDILDVIESEAHRFAGALLLPAETYPAEIFTTRLAGFVQLKERWKVSVAAQLYRCHDLGLLSDDQVLNLRKQMSKQKWKRAEPLDDILKPEQPSLLKKSFDLVTSSKVATASELLTRAKLDANLLAAFYNVDVSKFLSPPSGGPQLKLTSG